MLSNQILKQFNVLLQFETLKYYNKPAELSIEIHDLRFNLKSNLIANTVKSRFY